MKKTNYFLISILGLSLTLSMQLFAQHEPPRKAYEVCAGKKTGDHVQHMTREEVVDAICTDSPQGLVARPTKKTSENQKPPQPPTRNMYNIDQALSDKAQLNTIAFDGLAFITGDFGLDTFLPPGKVSDYFGFQFMRDTDALEGGHQTSFLTKIASNMLSIMNSNQKEQLKTLAQEQELSIRHFAQKRFPLIKAFRLNAEAKLPAGTKELSKSAVIEYSANLYKLDGEIAYERAKVMGKIIRSFDEKQKASISKLKFGDSHSWPDIPEPLDKKSMSHEMDVAVMTYSSEMFSWYAGHLEADTYFCPERHGMYFGGFGMKTAPAMGKKDYAISTSLTGDSGEAFLNALTETQRKKIVDLVELQKNDLKEIVEVRRKIAAELRRFLAGEEADKNKVLALSKRYGELDGELSYYYANAFAFIAQTLTKEQKFKLFSMRTTNSSDPKGPFLYSTPINKPQVSGYESLFK